MNIYQIKNDLQRAINSPGATDKTFIHALESALDCIVQLEGVLRCIESSTSDILSVPVDPDQRTLFSVLGETG